MDGPVLVIAVTRGRVKNADISCPHWQNTDRYRCRLCLVKYYVLLTPTFARWAAMRKRLFEFICPAAYRIHIYTFHAFCNEVIQENLEYFGKLNLEPLSDLESAVLFRELVDEFPNNHLLKRFTGDIYYDDAAAERLVLNHETGELERGND